MGGGGFGFGPFLCDLRVQSTEELGDEDRLSGVLGVTNPGYPLEKWKRKVERWGESRVRREGKGECMRVETGENQLWRHLLR